MVANRANRLFQLRLAVTVCELKTLSPDTSPEAEAVQLELLRSAPAWRKLQMSFNLTRGLKEMILADLQQRFPDDDEETRHRRLAHRWLGSEIASRAYGPPPEES